MIECRWILGFGLFFLVASPILAQEEGPISPPPTYESKHVTVEPHPGPPPIPFPELLQQVAKNEDAMARDYQTYTFQQTTRIVEVSSPAGPGGEFSVTGEVYRKADGSRYESIVKPPVSTLKITAFSLADIERLASIPLFILTTKELPDYDVSYEGEEKLDEIHTYILRVKPKRLDHFIRRFDGIVWVDEHDLAIVKTFGHFVTDVSEDPSLSEPFKTFEVYRENIVGHEWFPTYVWSDEMIAMKNGQLHLRLVMRSTDFKPESAAPPPAQAAAAGSAANTHPPSVPAQPAKP